MQFKLDPQGFEISLLIFCLFVLLLLFQQTMLMLAWCRIGVNFVTKKKRKENRC